MSSLSGILNAVKAIAQAKDYIDRHVGDIDAAAACIDSASSGLANAIAARNEYMVEPFEHLGPAARVAVEVDSAIKSCGAGVKAVTNVAEVVGTPFSNALCEAIGGAAIGDVARTSYENACAGLGTSSLTWYEEAEASLKSLGAIGTLLNPLDLLRDAIGETVSVKPASVLALEALAADVEKLTARGQMVESDLGMLYDLRKEMHAELNGFIAPEEWFAANFYLDGWCAPVSIKFSWSAVADVRARLERLALVSRLRTCYRRVQRAIGSVRNRIRQCALPYVVIQRPWHVHHGAHPPDAIGTDPGFGLLLSGGSLSD